LGRCCLTVGRPLTFLSPFLRALKGGRRGGKKLSKEREEEGGKNTAYFSFCLLQQEREEKEEKKITHKRIKGSAANRTLDPSSCSFTGKEKKNIRKE